MLLSGWRRSIRRQAKLKVKSVSANIYMYVIYSTASKRIRLKFLFLMNEKSYELILNQLTLKCTARSAWMHCKKKKQ